MNPHAATALSRYRSVQVTTASPGQLLVMLYDGLFRFMGEAQAAIRAKDHARAGERINRSHAILEQLLLGLNPEVAPQLCEYLAPLYRYCMERLIDANIHQDPDRVGEVIRVLDPLRDAWRQAVAQLAAAGNAAGTSDASTAATSP